MNNYSGHECIKYFPFDCHIYTFSANSSFAPRALNRFTNWFPIAFPVLIATNTKIGIVGPLWLEKRAMQCFGCFCYSKRDLCAFNKFKFICAFKKFMKLCKMSSYRKIKILKKGYKRKYLKGMAFLVLEKNIISYYIQFFILHSFYITHICPTIPSPRPETIAHPINLVCPFTALGTQLQPPAEAWLLFFGLNVESR